MEVGVIIQKIMGDSENSCDELAEAIRDKYDRLEKYNSLSAEDATTEMMYEKCSFWNKDNSIFVTEHECAAECQRIIAVDLDGVIVGYIPTRLLTYDVVQYLPPDLVFRIADPEFNISFRYGSKSDWDDTKFFAGWIARNIADSSKGEAIQFFFKWNELSSHRSYGIFKSISLLKYDEQDAIELEAEDIIETAAYEYLDYSWCLMLYDERVESILEDRKKAFENLKRKTLENMKKEEQEEDREIKRRRKVSETSEDDECTE